MPNVPAITATAQTLKPRTSVPQIQATATLEKPYFQLPNINAIALMLVPGRADPPAITATAKVLPPVFIEPIKATAQLLVPASHIPTVSATAALQSLFAFVSPPNADTLARVMRCRLIADSQTDLPLLISSFNARLNYGKESYISVVVPAVADLVDDIDLRKDGTIVVDYGYRLDDGSEALTELGRVNLQNISQSQGASSFSAVLDGYQNDPNPVPKEITLSKVEFINNYNGVRRVRAPVDVTLRPGDRVTLPDGSSLVAGSITYTMSASSARMEVSEVEDYDLLTDPDNADQGDTVTDANGNVTPVLPWATVTIVSG